MFKLANNIFATIKGEQYGLYINIDSNNNINYYITKANFNKNKFNLIDFKEFTSEIDVTNYINNKGIVSIFISGKGIIYKSFEQNSLDPEIAFNSVFKNINSSQFYYQVNGIDNNNWIAISRKSIIDPILENIYNKILVKSINILPPQNIEYLKTEDISNNKYFGALHLHFSTYLNSISNTEIDSHIIIDNKEISCNYNPAIYAITNSNKDSVLINYNYKLDDLRNYKITNLTIFYSSIIAITLLIINMFIFYRYTNNVALQQSILSSNESSISAINKLEKELAKKQKIIKADGVNNNFIYSRVISILGEQVPKDINLIELSVIPTRFRSDKVIITKNEIHIIGETCTGLGVTEYIHAIKQNKWIKEVNLVYLKNNTEKSISTFMLNAILKEGGSVE